MRRYAIILAGGSGTRMQSEQPKQFIEIMHKSILLRTLEKIYKYDDKQKIIVVLPYGYRDQWNEMMQRTNCQIPHELVAGGANRYQSALAGLIRAKRNAAPDDIILIHDGVRPLVSNDTIERCYKAAEEFGSGIASMPIVESLRMIDGEESYAVDRSKYCTIQTPQAFRAEYLIESYKMPYRESFTDDASVVEAAGFPINLVEGNRENLKITTPDDLRLAEALLQQRKK